MSINKYYKKKVVINFNINNLILILKVNENFTFYIIIMQ